MKIRSRALGIFAFCMCFAVCAVLAPLSRAEAAELNKPAPAFTLKSYDGKDVSLADYKGKTVVLEWVNPHCPFVLKHYNSGHMQKMQAAAAKDGVVWLSINSTGKSNQNYLSPEEAAQFKADKKVASAALLVDADGKVGKLYEAKTTPHMFVIDKSGTLVYQGAIDDQADTDGNPDQANNHVEKALAEVLAGKPVTVATTNPYGCSVKYES